MVGGGVNKLLRTKESIDEYLISRYEQDGHKSNRRKYKWKTEKMWL